MKSNVGIFWQINIIYVNCINNPKLINMYKYLVNRYTQIYFLMAVLNDLLMSQY